MSAPTSEGYIPFSVPAAGKPCQTYYKIYGDLKSGVTPVITLHGGPGAPHHYMTPFVDLVSGYGIPVVFYDQIGCGGSTRLPEKMGATEFWTVGLFEDEFRNLISHLGIEEYDILGHSWGAMLAMAMAIKQIKGLRRMVLMSGAASMSLWDKATRMLVKTLPQEAQDALTINEENGTYDTPEYKKATGEFMQRFVCRMETWPEELVLAFKLLEEEPAAYFTMQGPSEFTLTGNFKTFELVSELHKIKIPTLLLNGAYDEAQDMVLEPAFREIPKVKWFTFAKSAHVAQWEEREKCMEIVGAFLSQ
ncbi:uncharacterized protein FIBRA_00477 [Fibroporia radiculosa]|uniref:AB hydrolase-1 domain-containing protein n=1 Tax=Fibroporia radiculosa TaxID=599839 RepID=J4H025_9APHY|nr:uncharacterized protein FIBRA_00477 [Fibroporia radiculosa]CCL98479.1 predicted protein [Fibroporia radiculosa]